MAFLSTLAALLERCGYNIVHILYQLLVYCARSREKTGGCTTSWYVNEAQVVQYLGFRSHSTVSRKFCVHGR